jgi:hypothetical protein
LRLKKGSGSKKNDLFLIYPTLKNDEDKKQRFYLSVQKKMSSYPLLMPLDTLYHIALKRAEKALF